MPDYSKTVIYMIKHKDDMDNKEVYVGHTTSFIERYKQHKNCCDNPNNPKCNRRTYVWMKNIGWNNLVMTEIEKYPCDDFSTATKREGFWVKYYDAINERIPARTPQEYRIDNRKHRLEISRTYYQNHKEDFATKSKIYRENNKEKLLAKKKEYATKHKEEIALKSKQNIRCSRCGADVRKHKIHRHQQTNKCQNIVHNICEDVLYQIIDKIEKELV